jgi:hypothetical protein
LVRQSPIGSGPEGAIGNENIDRIGEIVESEQVEPNVGGTTDGY